MIFQQELPNNDIMSLNFRPEKMVWQLLMPV